MSPGCPGDPNNPAPRESEMPVWVVEQEPRVPRAAGQSQEKHSENALCISQNHYSPCLVRQRNSPPETDAEGKILQCF